jgi:Na+(H+)/acetate symporter ActP
MNRIALGATILIVVRQVVAQLHGMAHDELGVGLAPWQWAFVYTVIAAAPILALVLYWTRYAAAGAMLLGVSMLAGMLFGIYYHFIAVSPDNVAHLPEGHGQGFFIATAVLLVPIEIAGTLYGFWSYTRLRPRGAQ